MKRIVAIALMGAMWFSIGAFLLYKGIFLLMQACTFYEPKNVILISQMRKFVPSVENAAILILSIGLFLGIMKGRFVLATRARKEVCKLLQIPEPIHIKHVFSIKLLAIMAIMMSLGMAMTVGKLSYDIRAMIDVAVGSALIQGAVQYFRSAVQVRLYGKENL